MTQIITLFKHSKLVEMALIALEKSGVEKRDIYAGPMKRKCVPPKFFDSMNHYDGVSLLDFGAILATILAVIGASIGFRMYWGPIIWGIIGCLSGLVIGTGFDFLNSIKQSKKIRKHDQQNTVVLMIIRCRSEKKDEIETILWENQAIGVLSID